MRVVLAGAIMLQVAGRGGSAMKTVAFAAEPPPIDLVVPAKLETATFALG